MEPLLGQIILFAGNFAPRGWALCEGQLLSINQYSALFSILGTAYGGDGRTTFGLPDLRGRSPLQPGRGPGLSNITRGQKGGEETVTLTTSQIPAHNHSALLNATAPIPRGTDSDTPVGSYVAQGGVYSTSKNTTMATDAIAVGNTGGNMPHDNRPPYLGVNYIIALQGVYPSRS